MWGLQKHLAILSLTIPKKFFGIKEMNILLCLKKNKYTRVFSPGKKVKEKNYEKTHRFTRWFSSGW